MNRVTYECLQNIALNLCLTRHISIIFFIKIVFKKILQNILAMISTTKLRYLDIHLLVSLN